MDRCKELMERLKGRGMNAALITSRVNRMYYSGFTGSAGALFLSEDRRVLLTDFRYTIQAKEQTKGEFEIVEIPRGGVLEPLRSLLQKSGWTAPKVGFEEETTTVAQFERLQELPCAFAGISAEILACREIKSPEEAEKLQRAQRTAEEAFGLLLPKLHEGITERAAANELIHLMRSCGAQDVSFAPIVASGPNGAMCHAEPGERAFQKGDLVVMDFGCIVDGYCSDMTRTIGVGTVTGQKREIYSIVLQAHEAALAAARPGLTGRELDAVARRIIAENGYGDCFGHSLGHGFGLEIHEAPTAGPRSEQLLKAGMTVTIEPGIYVEGLCGVRIEDCCLLTETGVRDFVTTHKELISI